MTTEEMIKTVNSIQYPKKESDLIFKVAKELGLDLKPTKCPRCLRDYLNILKEQLGLIENAALLSDFDKEHEYRYIRRDGVSWRGHSINQNTDPEIIAEFVKRFPTGYYEIVEKEKTEPLHEENINNED